MRSTIMLGNFIRGIDWTYQNLKKWPLGGQNGDFMLSKLNNRLVNPFLTSSWDSESKTIVTLSCQELLADGKAA